MSFTKYKLGRKKDDDRIMKMFNNRDFDQWRIKMLSIIRFLDTDGDGPADYPESDKQLMRLEYAYITCECDKCGGIYYGEECEKDYTVGFCNVVEFVVCRDTGFHYDGYYMIDGYNIRETTIP